MTFIIHNVYLTIEFSIHVIKTTTHTRYENTWDIYGRLAATNRCVIYMIMEREKNVNRILLLLFKSSINKSHTLYVIVKHHFSVFFIIIILTIHVSFSSSFHFVAYFTRPDSIRVTSIFLIVHSLEERGKNYSYALKYIEWWRYVCTYSFTEAFNLILAQVSFLNVYV